MKKQTQKKRPEKGAKNTDRAAIILSLFREFPNNKFSLKHLASASGGATKEGRRETFEILGRLHDEGIVEECAREKYRLTHKHLPHFEGVADMTATGSIYVRVEGEEKDIFVNQRNTANALNGDRVEVVAIHRGRDGKFEGEITRIVERSRKPYVGIAEVGAHQIFVRADSRRMPMDIYLSKRLYPDVKDGEKVVVRIADWAEGSKSPVGELIERLIAYSRNLALALKTRGLVNIQYVIHANETTHAHQVDEHMESVACPLENVPDGWLKVVFAGDPETIRKAGQYAKTRYFGRDNYFLPTNQIYLEIMPSGISKAAGMEELCHILNENIKKTIVIGDYYNDLEIMKKAGYSVAVANAPSEVKAAANEVTNCDCTGGAVGEFLYKLISKVEGV